MTNLIPIGRFAQITHFSVKALRIYADAFMSFTVKVKEVQEQPLVSICRHAVYGTFGQVIRSALRELLAYAIDAGVSMPEQAPLVILHQSPPQQDREAGTDLEIGLPVQRTVDGGRGIVSTMLPRGTVASVIHMGPYHELEIIYPALGAWIEEHGYIVTGPPRNIILTNYASVSNPTEYQTEVMWPITRHASSSE